MYKRQSRRRAKFAVEAARLRDMPATTAPRPDLEGARAARRASPMAPEGALLRGAVRSWCRGGSIAPDLPLRIAERDPTRARGPTLTSMRGKSRAALPPRHWLLPSSGGAPTPRSLAAGSAQRKAEGTRGDSVRLGSGLALQAERALPSSHYPFPRPVSYTHLTLPTIPLV